MVVVQLHRLIVKAVNIFLQQTLDWGRRKRRRLKIIQEILYKVEFLCDMMTYILIYKWSIHIPKDELDMTKQLVAKYPQMF